MTDHFSSTLSILALNRTAVRPAAEATDLDGSTEKQSVLAERGDAEVR